MKRQDGENNNSYVHGMSNTPEYRSWRSMLSRCYNPNATGYKNYGGRGIVVCREWRYSFLDFLDHIGPRPSLHSIERIRNGEGYKPGNVKWASRSEQGNNKRNNRIVKYRGKKMPLIAAIREAKSALSHHLVRERIDRGWPIEHALVAPKYASP